MELAGLIFLGAIALILVLIVIAAYRMTSGDVVEPYGEAEEDFRHPVDGDFDPYVLRKTQDIPWTDEDWSVEHDWETKPR